MAAGMRAGWRVAAAKSGRYQRAEAIATSHDLSLLDQTVIGWFTALVLYALIWWTVLFAILPVGTRAVEEADPKSGWRGVPERPRIGLKVVATTLVAALVWGGCIAVIESPYLSFRTGFLAIRDQQ